MQDPVLAMDGGPQLSQGARVANTFVAPSKTFADILRGAACWLPLVIIVIVCLGYGLVVDKKVGFAAVSEVQMAKNPKYEERMASATPEQRAAGLKFSTVITEVFTYGAFVVIFIIMAIEALILWASFNFGLGAQTTFPKVFAVVAFASLPRSLLFPLISVIMLFAGVGTENFDIQNPAGTNLGYYLADSSKWMQAFGRFFDVFGLWQLALIVLGMAIISRKSISQSATVVLGWWALLLIVVVGFTALTS